MTHIDSHHAGSRPSIMPANPDMLEVYRPLLDGMTNCSTAICDGCAAMGKEWLSFIDRRLHADMSMTGKFANCRTPVDLMREWSNFMNSAADDYRNEFARLAELNTTTTQKAFSFVERNVKALPGSEHRTY